VSEAGGIKLVLDTSAVLAYAAHSIHVGEVISEVVDEDAQFGASVVCLAEGVRLVDPDRALGLPLLSRHPYFVPLPVLADDWHRVGAWSRRLGRIDCAAAVVEALDRPDGYLVTAEPTAYDDPQLKNLMIIRI
jgi:hypothetical protein